MEEKVADIRKVFLEDLKVAKNSKAIEDLKIKYLGRKGLVQGLMLELRNCSQDQRPLFGKVINELKTEISKQLDQKTQILIHSEIEDKLEKEEIDISLPGRRRFLGRKHPVSQILDEAVDILMEMGFSVIEGPEIESEYYNYGGLNYPEDHPARDMQDTYYISKDLLLRSHCTTIQQRMMEVHEPPIRIISPGKCYRNETISARSHVLFHQIDGFYVDKDVTFADLLTTLQQFYSKLFHQDVDMRVRPSYFPFVEPGMEVDISCTSCEGRGCRLCKETGWLEVCGAGMVHPEVLREGGVDPEEYSGFAWGGGVERVFMLRHGIPDIRLFTENDMRFLSQF